MSLPHEDFSELRKLLALKRHEQPPPGFYENFSDKVVARIEMEELTEYSSWWQWLVATFDAKPVVACVYGVIVSGLLFAGFKLSEQFEREMALETGLGSPWLATTPGSSIILTSDLSASMGSEASPVMFQLEEGPLFSPLNSSMYLPINRHSAHPAGFPILRE